MLLNKKKLAIQPYSRVRVSKLEIGRERNRIFVIDNVYKDPLYLRELVLSLDFLSTRGIYPGYEAHISLSVLNYWELISRITKLKFDLASPYCRQMTFARISVPRAGLLPIQRIPHYDQIGVLASVIYLNLPHQCKGGTAFYRHRVSGMESMPSSIRKLNAKMKNYGVDNSDDLLTTLFIPPKKDKRSDFLSTSDHQSELIKMIPMQFNRAVIFHSELFHSPFLKKKDFGDSMETCRLTQTHVLPIEN